MTYYVQNAKCLAQEVCTFLIVATLQLVPNIWLLILIVVVVVVSKAFGTPTRSVIISITVYT